MTHQLAETYRFSLQFLNTEEDYVQLSEALGADLQALADVKELLDLQYRQWVLAQPRTEGSK